MRDFRNTIRSLLRWSRITKAGDDTADFPVQQVGYLAKVGNSVMWFPYGMHANVPVDELCLMVSMQGNPEARVSIPGSPQKRVKPLAASEVVFFHPDTGSKLHFKSNGDIDIESTGAVNIRVAGNMLADVEGNLTAEVKGDLTAGVEGNLDVDAAGTVDIDSVGKTTITGGGTLKLDGITAVDIVAALVEASDGGSVSSLCNEAFITHFNAHTHADTGTPNNGNAVVGTHTTTVLKGE